MTHRIVQPQTSKRHMIHGYHKLLMQKAWQTLESFFQQRGQRYFGSISNPELSQIHCSRLSAYLA